MSPLLYNTPLETTFGTSGDNYATPPTTRTMRSNLAPAYAIEAPVIS